jgi:undecaprenyl-diphosphatase
MELWQIITLAVIQGAAELLPVSSSAHVIMAEKWMGLDPSAPPLTFLLVMLHTGTMVSVMVYFWPRWRKLQLHFFKMVILATAVTGVLGLSLKFLLEKYILPSLLGETQAEVEHLFKATPLIATALFIVGILIFYAGARTDQLERRGMGALPKPLNTANSVIIGLVQGLCLPFRGLSRSGATISTGMLLGVKRALAEDFSFALAVMVTPPVILLQLFRLFKASNAHAMSLGEIGSLVAPGMTGMVFSFFSGLVALHWLSAWLEQGRWKYFGVYCWAAALAIYIWG